MIKYRRNYFLIVLITAAMLFSSCQKEIDGLINGQVTQPPVTQKPKLGTTWTYRYYSYYLNGGIATTKIITYEAKSEETYGGETWLKIVDQENDTLIYFLKAKPDGLYQFINNNSYLFCKDSAMVNDTYNSFNNGFPEIFTVKGVNDSLDTNLGRLSVNYYEGTRGTDIIDKIWYSPYHWIIHRYIYFRNLSNVYFRRYAWFLTSIRY